MITFNNISVQLGTKKAVNNVSATAKSGELIALVGPNGSGKSSLIKAISALIPHTGSTNLPQNRRARSKQLAYLAQNVTAPRHHLVRDIVALGRTPHIGSLSQLSKTDVTKVEAAMQACGILDFSNRIFGELSGGEQTRVHLARTLATEAALLLADEPITALDPYYQLSVMGILRRTADQGTTIIAALHDLSMAKKFCDQVWVMNKGDLVAQGTPNETLTPEVLRDVFRITPGGEIAR